jgi:uncharacterized protein YaeQ
MALKATIHKAELDIVDMDGNYYAARRLKFGKGISDSDEPDLWQKDLAGAIERWIELGHPDERVLSKAIGRCPRVEEAFSLSRQLPIGQGTGTDVEQLDETPVFHPGRRDLVPGRQEWRGAG